MNSLLPIVFEALGAAEKWSPSGLLQITIFRCVIVRLGGLLVFYWTVLTARTQAMCWESFVGQQFYSAFVVMFASEFVLSTSSDFIWSSGCRNRHIFNSYQFPEFVFVLFLDWVDGLDRQRPDHPFIYPRSTCPFDLQTIDSGVCALCSANPCK